MHVQAYDHHSLYLYKSYFLASQTVATKLQCGWYLLQKIRNLWYFHYGLIFSADDLDQTVICKDVLVSIKSNNLPTAYVTIILQPTVHYALSFSAILPWALLFTYLYAFPHSKKYFPPFLNCLLNSKTKAQNVSLIVHCWEISFRG